jgi:predicted permease
MLDKTRYRDDSHQLLFVRSLIHTLRQIPGGENVAVASSLPVTDPGTVMIDIEGQPKQPANEQRSALDELVTSEYFAAVGLPLLRGRSFTEEDDAHRPSVVLVNQEFVRRYFQGPDPIGKRIKLDIQASILTWGEIVGVVSNVKSYSEETRVDPEVYESLLQRPVSSFSVLLRSKAEPNGLSPALRSAVAQLDPELPLARVRSLESVIEQQRNGNPLFIHLLSTFAILALILAAVGIYGLVAYSVNQRTHEISIRIALGAKTSDILRMILREGFKMVGIGSALGLIIALPLPRLFDAIFASIEFAAPELYVIVLAAILMVTTLATYVPARRAAQIDANIALRDQ